VSCVVKAFADDGLAGGDFVPGAESSIALSSGGAGVTFRSGGSCVASGSGWSGGGCCGVVADDVDDDVGGRGWGCAVVVELDFTRWWEFDGGGVCDGLAVEEVDGGGGGDAGGGAGSE